MFRHLFLDHPEEVGESYGEHLATATRFGAKMIVGGLACMAHAILPVVFKTSGSGTVRQLHDEMVAKRGAVRAEQAQMKSVDYVI